MEAIVKHVRRAPCRQILLGIATAFSLLPASPSSAFDPARIPTSTSPPDEFTLALLGGERGIVRDHLLFLAGSDGYSRPPRGQFKVLDISAIERPVVLGSAGLSGVPNDILLHGDYFYYARGYWIGVVDVSDPTAPVHGTTVFAAGLISTLLEVDGFLVAGTPIGLEVWSLSDPAQPTAITSLAIPQVYGITVRGDIAIVAAQDLFIVDIADPTAPAVLDVVPAPAATRWAADGNRAALGTGSGLWSVDLTDPRRPQVGEFVAWPPRLLYSNIRGFQVVRDLALVSDYYADETHGSDWNFGSMLVVDLSGANGPRLNGWLGGVEEPTTVMPLSDDRMLVLGSPGIVPTERFRKARMPLSTFEMPYLAPVRGIVREGIGYFGTTDYSLLYATAAFTIMDLRDPFEPAVLYHRDNDAYGLSRIAVSRGHALVSMNNYRQSFVDVYDVQDPSDVFHLGTIPPSGVATGPTEIATWNNLLLVSTMSGIAMHDLSTGFPFEFVGTIAGFEGAPQVMRVADDHLFLTPPTGIGRLNIVDLREDPPVVVTGLDGWMRSLYIVHDRRIFLMTGTEMLVYELSLPAPPQLVGRTDLSTSICCGKGPAVTHGDRLYIPAGAQGVLVVDIEDPRHPRVMDPLGAEHSVHDLAILEGPDPTLIALTERPSVLGTLDFFQIAGDRTVAQRSPPASEPPLRTPPIARTPAAREGIALTTARAGRGRVELVVDSPATIEARVSVHDVSGARIAVLQDGPVTAGRTRITWAWGETSVPSGVYFVRLDSSLGRRTAKVTIVR